MFEESLETIVTGLTHDTLTHDGEFYHYRDVPMQLRPLQKLASTILVPNARAGECRRRSQHAA